jgi:chromosome segregation ATPase
MSNLACVLWWLIPGVFLGWLSSWLFDMAFRRNGASLAEAAKADLAKSNARLQTLDGELTGAKARAASASAELARLNSELSATRTAHEQTQSKLGLIQGDLDGRTTNLSKYADEIAALRNQLQAARTAHDASERSMATLRAESDGAKAAASKLQAELQASTATGSAEISKLRHDYEVAQKAGNDVSGEVTRLRGELANATAARDTVQKSYAALAAEIDGAKGSATKYLAEIASLKGLLDASKSDTSQLTLLQSDLSSQKSALAAAMADGERTKLELGDARLKADELAKLKAEMATLSASYQTSQSLAQRLKTDLDGASRSVESANAELAKAQGDLRASQAGTAEHERLIALLRGEIEGNKRTQNALANRVADIERAAQYESERRISMTRYGFVSRTRDRDDLTLVEGIGPKIEELLLAARIDSHSKLAMSSVDELRSVLDAGGPAYKVANPGTWARQAALLVKGDFAELRRWQDELIAGVEMPKTQS